jgi:lysozyme family protein
VVHTYASLKDEYEADLARMVVTRPDDIDRTAKRLLGKYRNARYGAVPAKTGIPASWIAASFEREASSDFRCSPAQGDRWDRKSIHVPANRGPFDSWEAAALDAYHLDGLDKIGAEHWSWALCCYYGELFNGFGYRGKGIPSPYLWGGTNIQKRGKYVRDGVYDDTVMDTQLGIIPIMKRMVELEPSLQIGKPGVTPAPVVPDPTMRPVPPHTLHPAAPPIIVGAGGLMYWLHDHWVLLVAVAAVAVAVILALHRKSDPPLSPKAI